MAFEMSCAHCEGRMLVESLGNVVACPHCGTHLAIPDEIPGLDHSSPDSKTWSSGNALVESPSSIVAGSSKSTSESNVLISEPELSSGSEVPSAVRVANPDPSSVIPAIVTDATTSEPVSSVPVLGGPLSESASEEEEAVPELEPAEAVDIPDGFPVLDGSAPADSAPNIVTGEAVADSAPNIVTGETVADSAPNIVTGETASEEVADEAPSLPADAVSAIPVAEKSAAKPVPAAPKKQSKQPKQKPSVYDAVYGSRRGKLVPNAVFQVWLSYTILITGGLLMAIYYIFTSAASVLESLPDVKPPVEKAGTFSRQLVPEKARMPFGHTLVLHQTQRFGNIEVTPIKVTKGPLTLVGRDYVDESERTQHAGTVLKLWLTFKNVSEDQTIAPIDNDLLFFRHPEDNRKANNFLCRASEKHEHGDRILVYDHWTESDYLIQDANIGAELKPGEEITVFIPTEPESFSQLQGPLIWRVHIRKGYSPKNYGVTTIFEVEFDSSAIQSDSARA